MCGGSERLNLKQTEAPSCQEGGNLNSGMTDSNGTMKRNSSFSCLLEFAADNDVEGFKRLACDLSAISEVGVWYSYQKDSKHKVLEQRTPLMIAARYGSTDILRLITSVPGVDVNHVCDPVKSTALHCAASGGSANAADVVKLLLLAGADVNAIDANGNRPFDVIVAHPDFPGLKLHLQKLLSNGDAIGQNDLQSSMAVSRSSSPSPCETDLALPEITCNPNDEPLQSAREKKDYLIDPSFPGIKNSMYTTDEFRMYVFKIRPCSRAYSHDWTECPFAHPGENARRRDPRKFHYSCVPCPEFRRGACKNGDLCEYAHGVFESWLHPAQYRTRICKDGMSCARRVCFFAHTNEELRPLYVSSGSGTHSPRSANSAVPTMDMASALSLFPGSPSAISAMSAPPFSPPMSPTGNSMLQSSMTLSQQSMPMLNLPTSRLRSSLNARDIPVEELNLLNSPIPSPPVRSKIVTPSNLDELFSSEVSSPRCYDHRSSSSVLSPSHKSVLLNQFQLQQQHGMLSPIRTGVFSPKNADHPLIQASLHACSPRGMSPCGIDPLSPMSCRLSTFAHCEKLHQELQSLKSREFGLSGTIGSPINSRPKWDSAVSATVDWSVQPDDLIPLPKSSSKGNKRELPDFSWVQSLVKESPSPFKTRSEIAKPNSNPNPLIDSSDQAILGAWLEQLELDKIAS
ncbi:zinc finger CCCH domain-containing protein 56-like [Punica granatum]|nr:zinc finger CCCH domain-containing protein 56-like [Punica granatum]XP_031402897.1 zinc finger CCCH domain-containing protein 56-like [Punica granatum]PKI42501.1 hypothetical protein CRG98_037090 [Punica granatum]